MLTCSSIQLVPPSGRVKAPSSPWWGRANGQAVESSRKAARRIAPQSSRLPVATLNIQPGGASTSAYGHAALLVSRGALRRRRGRANAALSIGPGDLGLPNTSGGHTKSGESKEPGDGNLLSALISPVTRAWQHVRQHQWGVLSLNHWIVEDYRASLVPAVGVWEPKIRELSDAQLKEKTVEFRSRLRRGETLGDIQAEAFAVVREAARRTIGLRHFDVQIIGGAILHDGAVAEMKTGEGKTLVATLPAYLNALEGKGVHVVTVNDYLASRDADSMGRIHRFLGLSVGLIQTGMTPADKRKAYRCDITYANNTELGFDFLRDHLATDSKDLVLRWPKPFNMAIVDEVDSVLIDGGRNPLHISFLDENTPDRYPLATEIAAQLQEKRRVTGSDGKTMEFSDYKCESKEKNVELTGYGVDKAEDLLRAAGELGPGEDLWSGGDPWARFILTALRAKEFHMRDRDYIVKDGQVQIVDEFTGRVMENRRWSEGLHQAVEAKEGLEVQSNTNTMATITYQSFFKLYPKLSGMTGTAKTEETEFEKIYKMPVVVVPTNLPNIRQDLPLEVFTTDESRWLMVATEAEYMYRQRRPVLIGTTSVELSEHLSEYLDDFGVAHNVLNARPEYAAREAEIVAQAGRKGAVTISTNMAGRGTDIVLGGNPEMLARAIVESEVCPRMTDVLTPSSSGAPLFYYYSDMKNNPELSRFAEKIPLDWEGIAPIILSPEAEGHLKRAAAIAGRVFGSRSKPFISVEEAKALVLAATDAEADVGARSAAVRGGGESSESLNLEECIAAAYEAVLVACKKQSAEEEREVKKLGGLHVIGTSLHESRRVDNQLRGRAGRQGDPGSTKFMVSVYDDLLQRFGGYEFVSRINGMLKGLLDDPRMPVSHPMLEAQMANLQKRVEQYYFGIRKSVVEFDQVMEVQRSYFYDLRQTILMESAASRRERLFRWMQAVVDEIVARNTDCMKPPASWNLEAVLADYRDLFEVEQFGSPEIVETTVALPEACAVPLEGVTAAQLAAGLEAGVAGGDATVELPGLPPVPPMPQCMRMCAAAMSRWKAILEGDRDGPYELHQRLLRYYLGEVMLGCYQRRASLAAEQHPDSEAGIRSRERETALTHLTSHWQDHLLNMQRLRSAASVRSFGHMNPLEEYRIDGCRFFITMLSSARKRTVQGLLLMTPVVEKW